MVGHAVAVKYFKPYYIGFEWERFRREVAILAYVSRVLPPTTSHTACVATLTLSNWLVRLCRMMKNWKKVTGRFDLLPFSFH